MYDVNDEVKRAFRTASGRVYTRDTAAGNTIGVQSERMLHLILKYYLVPDDSCHEQKIGRYWADAVCDGHIYEIQTRRFDRLRRKLETFLETYEVTVVYPIAATKILAWVDPATGTMTKPRNSPRRRTIYDAFYELFFIREFLTHPHFHFRALLCEMEEFRALSGYGKDKKRRAPRLERIPTALLGEAHLNTPADYACLLPDALGARFTTPAFIKAVGLTPTAGGRAIHVFESLGLVREVGREGHAKLWERVSPDKEGTV